VRTGDNSLCARMEASVMVLCPRRALTNPLTLHARVQWPCSGHAVARLPCLRVYQRRGGESLP